MLIEKIEITHIMQCLADANKIRFLAETPTDLQEALPYLNVVLKGAIYNHAAHTITFTKGERIISLYPRQIWCSKSDDIGDAHAIIAWLKDLINETWERHEEMEPSFERRSKLTAISLYKLLPGLNCGKCERATCLAFAIELASEKASVLRCSPLFEAEFAEKRNLLLNMLRDAGYETPSVFTPPDKEAQLDS